MMRVVVLGSASPIKLGAVKAVCEGATVRHANVGSGVPLQPVGRQETEQGARNRARGAAKESANAAVAVGIENGIWEDDEGYFVDVGVVVVLDVHTGEEEVLLTDPLRICHRKGCRKCCCADDNGGKLRIECGPNGEWSVLKDPHVVLTKRSRKDFLIGALKQSKLLSQ